MRLLSSKVYFLDCFSATTTASENSTTTASGKTNDKHIETCDQVAIEGPVSAKLRKISKMTLNSTLKRFYSSSDLIERLDNNGEVTKSEGEECKPTPERKFKKKYQQKAARKSIDELKFKSDHHTPHSSLVDAVAYVRQRRTGIGFDNLAVSEA